MSGYDEYAEAERDRRSCEDAEFQEAWDEQISKVRKELSDEFNRLLVSSEDEPTIEVADLLMSGTVLRDEKLQTVLTDLTVLPQVSKALMEALAYPWNRYLRSVFCEAYLDANAEHIAKVRGLPSNEP
jgi:hypothetical protein